ncbi:MAG TPA: cytochrome c peroxidase [Blastocatellia bacterium]|nr:cytochrome c peroxidase [Blastocatellia bacterium]
MNRTSVLKLFVILLLGVVLPVLVSADDATPPAEAAGFDAQLPLGIPRDVWAYFVPKDNPMTAAKVELGRKLFFDTRLSADGTISCATCHDPARAFADGKRVAEGIGGRRGERNSPTLLNAMFNASQFWDGRAGSLEEQAPMPLTNPDEMGNVSHDQVIARLAAVPEYVSEFREAFSASPSIDLVARAIASFERLLVSGNSPLDRYLAGDVNALSDPARNGLMLFRSKARCGVCHSFNQAFAAFATFPFLTDMNYRNTGVAANYREFDPLGRQAMTAARDESGAALRELAKRERASELGRFVVTGNVLDIGAFRTPSLRNVELTAPYFHDGSVDTLAEVVRFYVKGGIANPTRDWQLDPVALDEAEQRDLVEFLKALTSDDARRMNGTATSRGSTSR